MKEMGVVCIGNDMYSLMDFNPDQCQFLASVQDGDIAAVQSFIIEGSVQLNAPDTTGMTPLMWAAHEGHYLIAKALLEAGADPMVNDDACRSERITALDYAMGCGFPQGDEQEFSDDEDYPYEYDPDLDEDSGPLEPNDELAELIRSYM